MLIVIAMLGDFILAIGAIDLCICIVALIISGLMTPCS